MMSITTPVPAPASLTSLPSLTGVLFFPVTPFSADGSINEAELVHHVSTGVEAAAGAVFIACGTGEFHALSIDEYGTAVRLGVTATDGRVPVIAGVGGPIGHALAAIRLAEDAGADGLLILPPYLVAGPQEGIARYVEQIAAATTLPVIAYHRGAARFTLSTVQRLLGIPNLAGIKDGAGDVALMQQFVNAARAAGRHDIEFFNGLLTAEASQAAYRAIGVPLYSSAVFAMAPDIAGAFYAAYIREDADAQRVLLDGFYTPLVQLRDEVPGFAVSLIKAGLAVSGRPVGSVRAPLVDPNPRQRERLVTLLADGRRIAAELGAR